MSELYKAREKTGLLKRPSSLTTRFSVCVFESCSSYGCIFPTLFRLVLFSAGEIACGVLLLHSNDPILSGFSIDIM